MFEAQKGYEERERRKRIVFFMTGLLPLGAALFFGLMDFAQVLFQTIKSEAYFIKYGHIYNG